MTWLRRLKVFRENELSPVIGGEIVEISIDSRPQPSHTLAPAFRLELSVSVAKALRRKKEITRGQGCT